MFAHAPLWNGRTLPATEPERTRFRTAAPRGVGWRARRVRQYYASTGNCHGAARRPFAAMRARLLRNPALRSLRLSRTRSVLAVVAATTFGNGALLARKSAADGIRVATDSGAGPPSDFLDTILFPAWTAAEARARRASGRRWRYIFGWRSAHRRITTRRAFSNMNGRGQRCAGLELALVPASQCMGVLS